MKYCTQCGKQINETAKFCPFCGAERTAVNPESSVIPEEPVIIETFQPEIPETAASRHSQLDLEMEDFSESSNAFETEDTTTEFPPNESEASALTLDETTKLETGQSNLVDLEETIVVTPITTEKKETLETGTVTSESREPAIEKAARHTQRMKQHPAENQFVYIKKVFQDNIAFICGCLLFALIMFNFSKFLGFVLLLGTAALLIAPGFLLVDPTIDYLVIVKERLAQLSAPKSKLPPGKSSAAIHSSELAEAVNETSTNPDFAENGQTAMSSEHFILQKKGRILNYIFLGIGFFWTMLLYLFFGSILGFASFSASGMTLAVAGFLFFFDFIFYLPALLYHASLGGKIVMFILNALIGGTVIGWIVLLLYTLSRNRQYNYQEEMLHYQRRMQR